MHEVKLGIRQIELSEESIQNTVATKVKDLRPFHGLASYYNNISFFFVSDSEVSEIRENKTIELQPNEWIAIVGRFKVIAIGEASVSIEIDYDNQSISFPNSNNPTKASAYLADKSSLANISQELDQLHYGHLSWPISSIAKLIEGLLVSIHNFAPTNWGISIVLLAVTLKILLLPLSLLTSKLQRSVSKTKALLGPKIAEIKSSHSGEEAHNRIVAAHKEAGVSLFYTLKPMGVTLIQIPILIAVFNALGEMPQLAGQSFLWISDLSYPDNLGTLPFAIPLLGQTLSLLPLLMATVSIVSSLLFTDSHLSEADNKKQKLPLYIMAAAFLLLFYPFPAAMVLYWTLNNALHLAQQRLLSKYTAASA